MTPRIATIARPAPTKAFRGLPVMLLAAFLFAILGLLIKILGPAYRVWDIAVYRFVGGALILYAVFRFRQNLFRPARPRLMLIRGVIGSIAFLALTYAIRTIPLSTAMVLFYSFPAFAALFSPLLSNDRIRLYEVGCIILALAGVGVIFDFQMQGSLTGQIMAVVAAVFAGLTIALIRILRQTHDSVIIYFFLCLVGGAVSMGPFLTHPRLPQTGIELMIVGGILLTSIIAQILMNYAFKYCKSWEGGLFMTSEVVFAAIFGILFLNEEATWRFWIGGALIFASAIAFNLQNRFAKRTVTGNQQGESASAEH